MEEVVHSSPPQSFDNSSDDKVVWVIGYYGFRNLGDDMFGHVFQKIIPTLASDNAQVVLINADEIAKHLPPPANVVAIFVGGGDLINDYFMKKLAPLLEKRTFRTCPIYAIGVGIPYPQLIEQGYLDGFDYIVHRSASDHQSLVHRYQNGRENYAHVHYSPDLAWSLVLPLQLQVGVSAREGDELAVGEDKGILSSIGESLLGLYHAWTPFKKITPETRRIGVCLARPMFDDRDPSCYEKIVEGIAQFLFSLATQTTVINKRSINKCTEGTSTTGGSAGDSKSRRTRQKNLKKRSIKKTYHYLIELIPFQVNDKKPDQDDRVINQDVMRRMLALNGGNTFGNVTVLNDPPALDEIVPFFRRFHFTLCSRFHAHVFSLIAQVPFISMHCTRKVATLVSDANMQEFVYQLPTHDTYHYPLTCDFKELSVRFENLLGQEAVVRQRLAVNYKKCITQTKETQTLLSNLLFYLPSPVTNFIQTDPAQTIARFLVQNQTALSLSTSCVSVNLATKQGSVMAQLSASEGVGKLEGDVKRILTPGGLVKWGLHADDLDRVVRLMSMVLVGKPVSEYSWGIKENILLPDYNLPEACKWIFKHRLTESKSERLSGFSEWKAFNRVPVKDRTLANMEYLHSHGNQQDTKGKHRSGWDFVMSHLVPYHNPRCELIFDGYLDETFGWRYEVLRDMGRIPFTRPWSGILHHTAFDKFSENNLTRLFSRRAWKDSLTHCARIFTLSESLAAWVRGALSNLGFPHVQVTPVYHPTEFMPREKCFQWERFRRNSSRRLIQVGGWLRNTFAIYDFPTYIASRYTKAALKGKGMDHYYLDDEQFEQLYSNVVQAWDECVLQTTSHNYIHGGKTGCHSLSTNSSPSSSDSSNENDGYDSTPSCIVDAGKTGPLGPGCIFGASGVNGSNGDSMKMRYISPWIIGARDAALRDLQTKYRSVELLHHVDNDEYDELLANNVVFLNLVDCSAVNTVIECIVRNTPLLVNPLPAVVEYLGKEYPLYYNTLDEAAKLLMSDDKLQEAHIYLRRMNKSFLSIENFVFGVRHSL